MLFCVKGDRDCLEDPSFTAANWLFVLLNDFPYTSGQGVLGAYRHVSTLTDLTAANARMSWTCSFKPRTS